MADFTLDTSGAVLEPRSRIAYRFEDLTPFTQGFIRAGFEDLAKRWAEKFARTHGGAENPDFKFPGYSDLSPAALARIMADCEARKTNWSSALDAESFGRRFWAERQADQWKAFPPITFTLSDDGKVEIGEAK